MRTRQTVNICTIDKFICERDDQKYSVEEVLPLVGEHIQKNYDHTFPIAEFSKWADSDSEIPFYHNGIKYIWDCN